MMLNNRWHCFSSPFFPGAPESRPISPASRVLMSASHLFAPLLWQQSIFFPPRAVSLMLRQIGWEWCCKTNGNIHVWPIFQSGKNIGIIYEGKKHTDSGVKRVSSFFYFLIYCQLRQRLMKNVWYLKNSISRRLIILYFCICFWSYEW